MALGAHVIPAEPCEYPGCKAEGQRYPNGAWCKRHAAKMELPAMVGLLSIQTVKDGNHATGQPAAEAHAWRYAAGQPVVGVAGVRTGQAAVGPPVFQYPRATSTLG
jgi:hypothetical protein